MFPRVAVIVLLLGSASLAGCSDKLSFTSASIDAPSFDVSPDHGDATTEFRVTAGSWANGLRVTWDFGDGTSAQGTTAAHRYGFTNGIMTITLLVSDAHAKQSIATRTVTLGTGVNAKPTVFASASRDWVEVLHSIDLSARGNDRDKDPLTYLWTYKRDDSGIGQELVLPGNGPTSNVTFDAPGKFTVTVRARDPKGAEGTDTIKFDVSKKIPDPVFDLKAHGTLVAGTGGQKQASEQLWALPPPAPDTFVDAARYPYSLKYPASTFIILTWNDSTGQGAVDLDLELKNADDGKTVFTSAHRAPAPPFEYNFTTQPPGNYIVIVRAVTGAQVPFDLLVHANLILSPETVARVEGS